MEKQGYIIYVLAGFVIATLIMSITGTISVFNMTGRLSKVSSSFPGEHVQKIAEPTVENAKISLVVSKNGGEL